MSVVLAAALLISFGLADWGTTNAQVAAFYLLPTRAWELMIGSLAALAVRQGWVRFTPDVEEGLGITGVILIAYAVKFFDETSPFPGFPALVPTLGALFILLPARTPPPHLRTVCCLSLRWLAWG